MNERTSLPIAGDDSALGDFAHEDGRYRFVCERGHHVVSSSVDVDVCAAVVPWPASPGCNAPPCGADIEYRVICYQPVAAGTASDAEASTDASPSPQPSPAEEKVVDLMEALEQSVREAREARARQLAADLGVSDSENTQ